MRLHRRMLIATIVMALGPGAAAANAGTSVHLYQVWHVPAGTVVNFKFEGGACVDHAFNGSFTVTSDPMVRNAQVLEIPNYNPLEKCFYVPSAGTWKVTATPPGKKAHSIKLLLNQKPQLPLQRHQWQVHCAHSTDPNKLGCHGGTVPDIIGGWPPVVFFHL